MENLPGRRQDMFTGSSVSTFFMTLAVNLLVVLSFFCSRYPLSSLMVTVKSVTSAAVAGTTIWKVVAVELNLTPAPQVRRTYFLPDVKDTSPLAILTVAAPERLTLALFRRMLLTLHDPVRLIFRTDIRGVMLPRSLASDAAAYIGIAPFPKDAEAYSCVSGMVTL